MTPIIANTQTSFEVDKEVAKKIRAEYGEEISDYDVLEIHRTQLDNLNCENCDGTCKKLRCQGYITSYKLMRGYLYSSFAPCKYTKAKNLAAAIKNKIRNAEIPEQYQGLTFSDYRNDAKNRDAVLKAHWCLDNKETGLYLYGNPGVGKTMLAAIIANESLKQNRTVIFSKVADLLRNIRATYKKESEQTEFDVLDKLYKCDVLIIDDMRPECGKKFASETLFDIIDYRYNAKKQTIITSNGTIEEIRDALNNPTDAAKSLDGTRIYDRCKDMMKLAYIGGESRRGRRG